MLSAARQHGTARQYVLLQLLWHLDATSGRLCDSLRAGTNFQVRCTSLCDRASRKAVRSGPAQIETCCRRGRRWPLEGWLGGLACSKHLHRQLEKSGLPARGHLLDSAQAAGVRGPVRSGVPGRYEPDRDPPASPSHDVQTLLPRTCCRGSCTGYKVRPFARREEERQHAAR